MNPSGYDPVTDIEHGQTEEMAERRIGSSWQTWVIVRLVIAALVVLFMVFGEPDTSTQTTLTPSSLTG